PGDAVLLADDHHIEFAQAVQHQEQRRTARIVTLLAAVVENLGQLPPALLAQLADQLPIGVEVPALLHLLDRADPDVSSRLHRPASHSPSCANSSGVGKPASSIAN